MTEEKLRKIWEGQVECAHCKNPNDVKIQKKIITPAEPAETEIVVTVEKSTQSRLD